MVEDIALTFGWPALGLDILPNRKCNKKRGFLMHHFGDIKSMTRGLTEKAINKLFSTKECRTLQNVTEDEKSEQLHIP